MKTKCWAKFGKRKRENVPSESVIWKLKSIQLLFVLQQDVKERFKPDLTRPHLKIIECRKGQNNAQ